MKNLVVLVFGLAVIAAASARPSDNDKYTDQYDHIDVDEILQSERLRNNYFHCLKTGEKCTSEGKKLREIIPDALKNGCRKCTDVQNTQSKRVLIFILKNYPEQFKELEEVYDPDHYYRTMYADEIKKEGLVLPD